MNDATRNLKSNRMLFIDDSLIEQRMDIVLTPNAPQKRGPVVLQDRPWRSKLAGYYGTVIADGGLYKMWTNCGEGDTTLDGTEQGYGINYGKRRYMQLLISVDGVHWESPSLGVVDFRGSTDNNLVMSNSNMEGTVFLDPQAADSEKFKFLTHNPWPSYGLHLFSSADGIRWSMHDERLLSYLFDSQTVVFWDASIGKYVCYLRGWDSLAAPAPGGGGQSSHRRARTVVRVEVERLEELRQLQRLEDLTSEKPVYFVDRLPAVLRCDELDPPNTDIYTNAVVKYPLADDVYLAFPAVYSKFPASRDHRNDGMLEVQMAVSRDGKDWNRIRQPYFRSGPVGEIDSASTYMFAGMIAKETEIYQYYWGSQYTHGGRDLFARWNETNMNAIHLVSQRIDGFVSADAPYSGGMLVTKPFRFTGGQLIINIDTSATGTADVALLDEAGREIEGYELESCDTIKGNFINRVVSWQGNADVSRVQGQPVKLRFTMRNAKLYSFRFA
ncbi:MAG: hypothetical protein K0Q59_2535 [Paenibacillus sp.]|nr:hypothetical protein [Paenibacillus sp.]